MFYGLKYHVICTISNHVVPIELMRRAGVSCVISRLLAGKIMTKSTSEYDRTYLINYVLAFEGGTVHPRSGETGE